MDQDDFGPAELCPSGHHLPQKSSVVGDDLEVKTADAAAGPARAALVGGQDAPPSLEGDEGVVHDIEQRRRGDDGAVETEREHGVALHLLNREGRRQPVDHNLEQIRDDRRPVLELGPGHELGEA